MFATSVGSVNRPRGTLLMKLALFSGVSGTPANDSKLNHQDECLVSVQRLDTLEMVQTHSRVPLRSGQTELTRI